jgi:hypothetical protein
MALDLIVEFVFCVLGVENMYSEKKQARSLRIADLDVLQDLSEIKSRRINGGGQMGNQQMLSAESQKLNFLMQAINTTMSALGQAMKSL